MRCQQCGNDINNNAKFCKYCGNPVVERKDLLEKEENVKLCPKCGKQTRSDNLFCTNCGSSLSENLISEPKRIIQKNKKKITIFLVLSIFVILGCCITASLYFFGDEIKTFLEDSFEKDVEQKTVVEDNFVENTGDKNAGANFEQDMVSSEEDTENTATTEEMVTPVKTISEVKSIDITASSALSEYGMTHSGSRIMDGDVSTAWVEGVDGYGIGEQISFVFDDEYELNGFKINAGYQKNEDIYKKNSRPEEIYIKFSDGSGAKIPLEDINGVQDIKFGSGIVTEYIIITINSVYEGNKYEDTVISEILFY